jgi:hypothetical protein
VTVAQLDDGRWRLSQPRVPGWAAAVRSPGELAAALRAGFTEAQVSAYSTWRGHAYDTRVPVYRRSRPKARSRRRCDVYDPTMWQLDPDDPNKWISPKGHKYPEDRQAVQRVMAARVSLGLPARPDPAQPDAQQAGSVTSMTARRVEHLDQQPQGRPA